ncbi:MAG TPA: HlyD family efflux transporter periplasmic adaptor subunit [Myxococcota bacterium]|nr:HlyD family efflux transporter periplasmic adaptor subunit [Myxococcota bacterium]
MRRRVLIALLVAAAVAGAVVWRRSQGGEHWYTGFVEGEERVLRSEVSGRVLEVPFEEGDRVPANAVVARIDPADTAARAASKRQELGVIDAQLRRQEEQVTLAERTWTHDVAAGRAAVARAQADAELAAKDYERARNLRARDVASMQALDTQRSRHAAATSALARERELLRRAEAAEGEIAVARRQLDVLREQRTLTERQLAELEVQLAKHEIRAPSVDTVVQTKLLWPGELAQPGTAVLAVLDPRDKYVQIYVPVEELDLVRVGRRVEIELDSAPGRRVPGEIGFVADEANFTPEKIETRTDRMAQVYRAKVRILEDVERFQPGAEGNVYLVGEDEGTRAAGPTEARAPGAR